jgi:hypothetical protein
MDVHELSGVLGAGQASMPIRKVLAELLTWIGIIGGCLTLFRAFADVMPLSHWAIALLAAWHFVTAEIPAFVLAKLGLAAPTGPAQPSDPAWVGAKSFFLFTIPLGFGLRLKASQLALGWRPIYIAFLKGLAHWLNTFRYIMMAVVAFVVMAMIFPILDAIKVNPLSARASLWLVVTVAYLIVISAIIYHQATAEESSWVIGVGNGILLLIAYTVLAVFPRLGAKRSLDEFMDSFGLFGFITMPLLILAPPRPMLRRLAVLLLGLAVLVLANIATHHIASAGRRTVTAHFDTPACTTFLTPSYKAQRSRLFCPWLSGIAEQRLEPDPAQ